MSWRIVLAWALPAALSAAEPALQPRLIADVRTIEAGKPFHLGLILEHPPGTHTYWKDPGIVGVATTIRWVLPQGFRAGEVGWPAPQVVKMAGHTAQGYQGTTMLIFPVTPPQQVDPRVTLSGFVSGMCCGKTCTPFNEVPVSLTLDTGLLEIDPDHRAQFETYRAQVPVKSNAVSAKRDADVITLEWPDPVWPHGPLNLRFFTLDGAIDSDQPQSAEWTADGVLRMKLRLLSGRDLRPTLHGVIAGSVNGEPLRIEIDPQIH